MICQHCRTEQYEAVILDDDYRCKRCGRRVRSTPSRPSANRFPVEAAATARAYEIDFQTELRAGQETLHSNEANGDQEQQRLFSGTGSDARVIAFDSLTSRAERQSIHARAAGLLRPAPLKAEKIQVRHARASRANSSSRARVQDQRRLEFEGQEGILAQPKPSIICDAPVAPARLRLEATFIDGFIMAIPLAFAIILFKFAGGSLGADKYTLPLVLLCAGTIPVFYKLLWTFAGADSIGMRQAGLRLVDFDGNPPSQSRRYLRFAGSFLSLLAAGVGLIWSLADEDALTWHDHISSTFPTLAFDDEV